jgi:hypothetical protein
MDKIVCFRFAKNSGKIMRRILRKIAEGDFSNFEIDFIKSEIIEEM